MMNKSKTWTGRPRKEVNSINSTPNISYKNKHKTNWNLNTGLAKPCDTQGCHMKLQTPPQPDKWSCSAVFQTDSGCPGTSFPKAGGVWRRQQQCWWCHVVWKPSDLVGGSAGWGVVGWAHAAVEPFAQHDVVGVTAVTIMEQELNWSAGTASAHEWFESTREGVL